MTLVADQAEQVDFERGIVFIGEDHTMQFTILTNASVAVDITGWAIEWVLKDSDASDTVVLSKTTGAGTITLTTPASGIGQFTILDTDTLTLPEGAYRHSLRRTDNGLEKVLAWGELYLTKATAR